MNAKKVSKQGSKLGLKGDCLLVYEFMRCNGTITNVQAEGLNCHRLSGRINNLREKGFQIKTEMVPNKEKKGSHAKYSLL